MRLRILLPYLALLFAFVAHASADRVWESCPTDPEAPRAEEQCLAAIVAAEQRGNHQQLSHLLEALAIVYEHQGRYEEAIEALRRALAAEPSHRYNATTRLATMLEKSGNLEEAREVLASIVPGGTGLSRADLVKKADLELRIAKLSAELGDPDSAERHYKISIEAFGSGLGPARSNPAVGHLIRFYLRQGRTEDAKLTCEQYRNSLEVTAGSSGDPCEKL